MTLFEMFQTKVIAHGNSTRLHGGLVSNDTIGFYSEKHETCLLRLTLLQCHLIISI